MCYRDLVISCHDTVNKIGLVQERHRGLPFDPSIVGSDSVERLFSSAGSMIANKRVYNALDFTQSWDSWIMERSIESTTDLEFPRPDTKRRSNNWFGLLVKTGERNGDLADLADLPDRRARTEAWVKGLGDAHEWMERLGMGASAAQKMTSG